MSKIEMQVLTASGCTHCHHFLKFWNAESASWENITLREIDILDREGQQMVAKHHIFSLPGVVIQNRLISTGEVDVPRFREALSAIAA
ncbi:MAG TPA: thioredoxin family protein [Candidatus Paceibacterota bacterium]|nr:thioredoxin family protein [Candidatus Paceibacterota bacterium]